MLDMMKNHAALDYMFTSSMSIPKLNMPKLVSKDSGYTIESNNLNVSVGWRNKSEKAWNIYTANKLIQPEDDFEVVLFRPGYKILIQPFRK